MRLKARFFVLLLTGLSLHLLAQERTHGTIGTIEGYADESNPKSLQTLVNMANPGDTIVLSPGFYIGPVYIKTPGITLDGMGTATISGEGLESVIHIETDSVTIKNFKIINSGGSHDKIDCGVKILGDYNIVENCRIEECLFGVDIFQSDYNKILHCEISSLSRRSKALKGDAIRLWYSTHNLVKHNYWHHVRDMVVWYSSENAFVGNKGVGNRYSIHFMYSHKNRIQFNEFYENSVGVFPMSAKKR